MNQATSNNFPTVIEEVKVGDTTAAARLARGVDRIIELRNVSMSRRSQEEFSFDLKKNVFAMLEGRYRKPVARQVLADVNLDVKAGEKLGIIGLNGSGKSTLLKVISGILKPTTGICKASGSIAPLIELGAGFDYELSVYDNILLYGILLGFSKQSMLAKIESILSFAELEDYANMPVKTLSSGMAARLGFAIATDVDPDILLLDEVLSIGDEHFKHKCQERLSKFWRKDSTVIVVSHDLSFMESSCTRAVCLDAGRIVGDGDPKEIVEQYRRFVSQIDDVR